MDPTLEIITGTSFLGAVLLIVSWFLKALKSRDSMLKDLGKDYEDSRDECHKVQRDAIEVIRETSRILGENTAVLREIMTLLRRVNGSKP